jgi:hypothetical protein
MSFLKSQTMTAPYPVVYKKFECAGNGLTVSGHRRASLNTLKSALGLETNGQILKDGKKKVEKRPKSWWEAQVRLYGLKCTKWTIDRMKKVLMEAVRSEIEVSVDVKVLEERLNNEYAESLKNGSHNTEDDTEISDSEPDSKNDPLRLMREVLRLTSTAASATSEERAKKGAEFEDNAQKSIEASQDRQLAKINRKHALLLASPQGAGDDIFGTWQLDCPALTKQYCHLECYAKSDMVWVIHPLLGHDLHLWCSFKQMVVAGVMSIEWESALDWRNRKNGFTFRGETTGDGDFCCDDEWNKGWIVFTSEHECHGMFETQFGDEPWEFTGKKISLKRAGKQQKALGEEYEILEREWMKSRLISASTRF